MESLNAAHDYTAVVATEIALAKSQSHTNEFEEALKPCLGIC